MTTEVDYMNVGGLKKLGLALYGTSGNFAIKNSMNDNAMPFKKIYLYSNSEGSTGLSSVQLILDGTNIYSGIGQEYDISSAATQIDLKMTGSSGSAVLYYELRN